MLFVGAEGSVKVLSTAKDNWVPQNLHLDRMIHWSDIKFVLTVLGVFLSITHDLCMQCL